MKGLFPLCVILWLFLTCSGCSSTLYKHQQKLSACHTRKDISKLLGPPDEEIYSPTTEEWVYNLEYHNYHYAPPIIDSLDTSKIVQYDKNLKLTFDLEGNIIKRQSNVADPVNSIIRRAEQITPMRIVAATVVLALLVYVTAKTGVSF